MIQAQLLSAMLLVQIQTPPTTPASELARAAAAAFAARCVQCHGETLAHPKAGFGLMPNLRKLAADSEHVVPEHPEDSEVWKQISEGDMPPDGAKAGDLTDEERNAIFAWIKAGAPVSGDDPREPALASGQDAKTVTPTPDGQREKASRRTEPVPVSAESKSLQERAILLLGRLQVILIHFPIALLIAAAGAESLAVVRKQREPNPTVRFCVAIGAAAALVAAGLGWIRALDGFAGPLSNPLSLIGLHRWLGTLAALVACVTLVLSERDVHRGVRSGIGRVAILLAAAIVGAAGHFGGLLVHGRDYFSL